MPAIRRPRNQPLLDGDLGRQTTIADVEAAIASRCFQKDPGLRIEGLRKTLLGYAGGFTIYQVPMDWIKNNLDTTFGTGGHGLVHTFIPLHEIWIDPVKQPWAQIALHEAAEFYWMYEKSMAYAPAHERATRIEQRYRRVTPQTLDHTLTFLGFTVRDSRQERLNSLLGTLASGWEAQTPIQLDMTLVEEAS